MDAQAQAVPEAMQITIGGARMAVAGGMTQLLKVFIYKALGLAARLAHEHAVDGNIECSMHLGVHALHFRRRMAHAPCARKVIKISAASLARKVVKDDCAAKLYGLRILAVRVRHGCIAPDRKDHAFRILKLQLKGPAPDLALDRANGERAAGCSNQHAGARPVAGQKVARLPDDTDGGCSCAPDARHFGSAFGALCAVENCGCGLAHKADCRHTPGEVRKQRQRVPLLSASVNAYTARKAKVCA